jgi:hypothetical protein
MTARAALATSIKDIRAKIEHHQRLLECLEDGASETAPDCSLIERTDSRRIKEILLEAVEVLENSRRSFKSKELEIFRKKLIRVLADCT